ncbi:hypothetical protein AMR41_26295 [Hapalosiphon sp. MRB220]|nr:hypothetical protein AMR41_26295 [Hapalosiphon sp. MRB220]
MKKLLEKEIITSELLVELAQNFAYSHDNLLMFVGGNKTFLALQDIQNKKFFVIGNDETVKIVFLLHDEIAKLPSDDVLTLAYTKDLKQWGKKLKYDSSIIAFYFLVKNLEMCDYIRPNWWDIYDEKFIEGLEYLASAYTELWKLISLCFPKLKSTMENCDGKLPFEIPKNAKDLFYEIIKFDINSWYLDLFTYSYLEIKRENQIKYWEELSKINPDNNKLLKLKPTHKDNVCEIYLHITFLLECFAKQKGHLRIKIENHLTKYYADLRSHAACMEELWSKRTNQNYAVDSMVWRDGFGYVVGQRNTLQNFTRYTQTQE